MAERRTYWQGQVDAKLAQMVTDLSDIKAGVASLQKWRAKVIGAAVAASALVSGLWQYLGGGVK